MIERNAVIAHHLAAVLVAAFAFGASSASADYVRVETTAPTSTADCTLSDAIATALDGVATGACVT
ncbi:MAG: hypothetical protein AAFY88_32410, partial [Acidobacteriota bacterium]